VTSERSGFYRILRLTSVYDFVQQVIGSEYGIGIFVNYYLKPFSGARILDIGSGTGLLVRKLGAVDYLGIEPNSTYVDDFNRQFGTANVRMVAGTTATINVDAESFDIVLVSAVLHHVDDGLAKSILQYAREALATTGRVVLLDPVLHQGQGFLSRQLVSRDRGKHVRQEEDYKALFSNVGLEPKFEIRSDLNRFPYSHIITTATRE